MTREQAILIINALNPEMDAAIVFAHYSDEQVVFEAQVAVNPAFDKERLKQVLMVCDPHGQVSGYTVFNDGVKAYWTEGRGSEVKFILANGAETFRSNADLPDTNDSLNAHMELLMGDPPEAQREMTPAEQIEYMLEIEGRFR